MSEAEHVVAEFLAALRAGDMRACYEMFDADAVIDEAVSLPFGGVRTGHDSFRDLVTSIQKSFSIDVGEAEIHEAGSRVLVTATATVTARETGKSVTMPIVDLYTVKRGKVTRLDVFYKDTAAVTQLTTADSTTRGDDS